MFKKPSTIMKKLSLLATALATLSAASLHAEVTTDPVGFVSITVPAASDVALGAPLGRPSEFVGVIQSIAGSVITLGGTPGFTTDQFKYAAGTQPKTYFLRIDSGSKEGLILPITQNGTADVTVTVPAGESLSGILTNAADGNGDQASIAPYWTIGTLVSGAIAGTQIITIPTDVAGTNLTVSTYTFNGTNWIKGATVSTDVVLDVGQGVIARNNSTTTPITLSITGSVPMSSHRIRLATLAGNTKQDIRIFYNSPIPDVIGNVFNAGALVAGDQMLFIDNTTTGKNKPVGTLTWNGTNWIQGATVVTTTFVIQPGASYVFRKNKTTNPSSVVWTDLQSYLQ